MRREMNPRTLEEHISSLTTRMERVERRTASPGSGGSVSTMFAEDTHDVIAPGEQVVHLSYLPVTDSEHLYWNGIYQPGAEWSRDGRFVVVPAGGFLSGDKLHVEYAYRPEPDPVPAPIFIGTSQWRNKTTTQTSVAMPADTQSGDLLVMAAYGTSPTSTDSRMRLVYSKDSWRIWHGFRGTSSSAISLNSPKDSWGVVAAFRGVSLNTENSIYGTGSTNSLPIPESLGAWGVVAVAMVQKGVTMAGLGDAPGYTRHVAEGHATEHQAVGIYSWFGSGGNPTSTIPGSFTTSEIVVYSAELP